MRGKTSGFTLIEVLVVIAIIGILGGIFGSSLIRSIRTAELREAANQVASDFQRARSLSQRGSTNVTITAPKGTASGSYSVDGQARTLPNNIKLVCKTNCGTGAAAATTYQAPYGELTNLGSVFTVQSPASGVAALEIRIVGVTGKVILTGAS